MHCSIVDRDSRASDDEPSAFCTWSNHSLSVTKIVTGTGKAHAKVVSSSLDRTCRVWHIPSKSQLLVVTCPAHLNSCAMDAAETRLFMAGGDGVVYEAAISASGLATLQLDRGQTTARSAIDLIGAHRSKATDDEAQNSLQQYVGHTQSVADIAVTSNGSLLVSGSDDGTVRVWDTVSHQQVRRFEHHQGDSYALVALHPVLTRTPHAGGVGALLLIPYPEALSTSSTPMRFAPIAPLRKYGTAGVYNHACSGHELTQSQWEPRKRSTIQLISLGTVPTISCRQAPVLWQDGSSACSCCWLGDSKLLRRWHLCLTKRKRKKRSTQRRRTSQVLPFLLKSKLRALTH